MPAENLFRADAYLTNCAAIVTHSGPDGARLDRTNLYPTGRRRVTVVFKAA